VFDIQRTMREAYDKARRVLFDTSSTSDMLSTCSPTCVDVISDVNAMVMSAKHTGHHHDCPSTCTCFMVSALMILYLLCFKWPMLCVVLCCYILC